MSSYDFNAPVYINLESLETDAEESVATEDKENIPNICATSQENVHKTDPPVEHMEVEETVVNSCKKSNKTPNKNLNLSHQPVRQSPRLASIAKCLRRANASKGHISMQSPTKVKYHRRSLSAGANVSNSLNRVRKNKGERKGAVVKSVHNPQSTSSSGFTVDELHTLEETTQIKKALSNNRTRTFNIPKGPLKAAPLKPTQTKEFKFATDSRIRKKSDNCGDDDIMDFQKSLRSNSSVTNEPPKNTKIEPFNLHNPAKPKEKGQPFQSMAELNLKFQTKTPQRFRTKPSNFVPPDNKRSRNMSGELTQPQTPNLMTRTRTRARSVDIPSREEIEQKEFEEAKRNQFKAIPLNKKVLEEPPKKVNSERKVTVPEPFDITDTKKESLRVSSNKLTLHGGSVETLSSSTSSQSIASSVWEKKRTEPKPFSFDARDAEMIKKKKEKIKKMIEEEKKLAEFHAQPMPVLDTVKGVPPKKPPTPTKLQPFNLKSDIRGSAKQQMLQSALEDLERLEEEQRKFVAQPDTVIHKKPFIPMKSRKPSTIIDDFQLNTDKRAEERRAFDEHLKEKEEETEAMKKLMEERKRKEEEEEIKELRKQAVHKAQPIHQYKPVNVQLGLMPPTVPLTPKFTIEERLKNRALSKQALNSTEITTENNITDTNTNDTLFDNDTSAATVESNTVEKDGTFTMEKQ